MNNLSDNKVILTDEKYKSVRRDLVTWYICLVIKLALIALCIFLVTRAKWFFSVWGLLGGAIGLILSFVSFGVLSMVHELQTTSQNSVDKDYLSEGNDWRFLEIFPGKGIRLAQREMRRYRRQKKLQEKGHKNATDHSDK